MAKVTAGSAAKAMEVFETVELMEEIMLYLNAHEVLASMQVVRSMRDTVLGSSKIQKQIGLLPDLESNFRMPLWPQLNSDDLPVEDQGFHGLVLNTLNNTFDRSFSPFAPPPPPDLTRSADFTLVSGRLSDSLLKLGQRCQDILVCQPPVKSMGLKCSCWNCPPWTPDELPDARGKVVARDGQYITLGDIQRSIFKCRAKHRSDCEAKRDKADVSIEIMGMTRCLSKSDPLNISRARHTVECWEQCYGSRYVHWRYKEMSEEDWERLQSEELIEGDCCSTHRIWRELRCGASWYHWKEL